MSDAYWRQPPCGCPLCRQSGVSDKPLVRDGRTHEWLHGEDLRRWYEAKADFDRRVAEISQRKGMR